LVRRGDLEKGNWVFTHFSEEDKLCNDVIYAIQEDGKGRLWMSICIPRCRSSSCN